MSTVLDQPVGDSNFEMTGLTEMFTETTNDSSSETTGDTSSYSSDSSSEYSGTSSTSSSSDVSESTSDSEGNFDEQQLLHKRSREDVVQPSRPMKTHTSLGQLPALETQYQTPKISRLKKNYRCVVIRKKLYVPVNVVLDSDSATTTTTTVPQYGGSSDMFIRFSDIERVSNILNQPEALAAAVDTMHLNEKNERAPRIMIRVFQLKGKRDENGNLNTYDTKPEYRLVPVEKVFLFAKKDRVEFNGFRFSTTILELPADKRHDVISSLDEDRDPDIRMMKSSGSPFGGGPLLHEDFRDHLFRNYRELYRNNNLIWKVDQNISFLVRPDDKIRMKMYILEDDVNEPPIKKKNSTTVVKKILHSAILMVHACSIASIFGTGVWGDPKRTLFDRCFVRLGPFASGITFADVLTTTQYLSSGGKYRKTISDAKNEIKSHLQDDWDDKKLALSGMTSELNKFTKGSRRIISKPIKHFAKTVKFEMEVERYMKATPDERETIKQGYSEEKEKLKGVVNDNPDDAASMKRLNFIRKMEAEIKRLTKSGKISKRDAERATRQAKRQKLKEQYEQKKKDRDAKRKARAQARSESSTESQ